MDEVCSDLTFATLANDSSLFRFLDGGGSVQAQLNHGGTSWLVLPACR
jgi:hypothetical protein